MAASLRMLWVSATQLYDEALPMVGGNLAWFFLTLPLHGLLLLLVLPVFEARLSLAGAPSLLPLLATAFLGLALPTPGAAGLYRLALPVLHGETTAFRAYWAGLRRYWRQGALLFLVGLAGLVLAAANVIFYFQVGGALQILALVWGYAAFFWLALQAYLYPLLLAFPGDSFARRYQRAALLTLANPGTSLLLLACAFLLAGVSLFAPPIYPLLAMAFLSLAGSRALAELQARYGAAGERTTR